MTCICVVKYMSGKNLLEGRTGPVTQSVDAIKSLLAYVGRASNPLPTDVSLEGGRVVLILSNKKDCYYVATQKACSCPANTWHPGQPCKHQRRYFAEQIAKPAAPEPVDSIKPALPAFRPFDTLPGEKAVGGA